MAGMTNTNIEIIAAACHQANTAYCLGIGDDSHMPWHDAPEWQRESARNGIRKLLENPESTPAQMHENWLREKMAQGWVYGPVKDAEAKTHPCCMPYAELPEEQRRKDDVFLGTARTMIVLLTLASAE